MSIWTSRALVLTVLLVAACGRLGGGPSGSPPVRAVSVTSDMVTVTGPEGFCVDPDSTRDSGDTAFVLMGNCAVISGRRSAGQPAVQAILTASLSEADASQTLRDAIPDLSAFFASEEGRQLLSRAGEADTVEVLDSFHQGDVFYLRARDSSASEIQNVSADYWRSYLDVGDRIATLTVLGRDDSPVSSDSGLQTLREFTQAVQLANESGAAPVAPVAPAAVPASPAQPRGTLWNVGLFRRIMGG
ncbi:hypothetical protein [Nioella ostreopsis]|uniref:hypothetical protein n=1 Tax=Nioella ostreopsis TaxID=2448479 RepID=UPI000FDA38FD|nr:hypothetical protein [Nioella ostreopsis]